MGRARQALIDKKGGKNTGTSPTFGGFRRDGLLVHRIPNPMTNRSHINFIMWETCGMQERGNVPVGSRPLI